ncbi:hypothetical protein PISMIDRAFT_684319 [Pisolithus microcarpus 441]|uniref:Uncharacterized protein n=1 Tax=Pisolithus microcarpus 441 TaxID=765257 RepID=A0A0C9ZEB7_9AGAM|nr:hypothetical protein PISMIDRAFT_684319 [Pisolithus microcarpus 441]
MDYLSVWRGGHKEGPWHLRGSIAVARHAYILNWQTEADAASIVSSVCHRLECFLLESEC